MADLGRAYVEVIGDLSHLNRQVDQSMSRPRLGKIGRLGGLAMAAGITAGIAGAKGAFDIGQQFADAMSKLRVETGKTGGPLRRLRADFRDVLKDTPATIGDASAAVGGLAQQLGIAGRPLRRLSKQLLELSRITHTDLAENIDASAELFKAWEVPTNRQAKALDRLFRIFQKTGLGVAENAQQLVQFSVPLQRLGLGLNEAATLFGKFEREGVTTTKMMSALRTGLVNFTSPTKAAAEALKNLGISTRDPKKALQETFDAIKQAPNQLIAGQVALAIFGKRAGPDLAQAIRQGRFELGDLTRQLKDSDGSIHRSAEATRGFREEWQTLKNKVLLGLEPLATRVFRSITRGLKLISDPKLTAGEKFDRISGMLTTALQEGLNKAVDLAGQYGPKIALSLVRGFFEAPLLAQLAGGAWLLSRKPKLLAVAAGLGRETGAAFAGGAAQGQAGGGLAGPAAAAGIGLSIDPLSAAQGRGRTRVPVRQQATRRASTGEVGAAAGGALVFGQGFRSGAPVSQLGPRVTTLERIGASRVAQIGGQLAKRAAIIGAALTALDLGTKILANRVDRRSPDLKRSLKAKGEDPVIQGIAKSISAPLAKGLDAIGLGGGDERARKLNDLLKDIQKANRGITHEQEVQAGNLAAQIGLHQKDRTEIQKIIDIAQRGNRGSRGLDVARPLLDSKRLTDKLGADLVAGLNKLPDKARKTGAETVLSLAAELKREGKIKGSVAHLRAVIEGGVDGIGRIRMTGPRSLVARTGLTMDQIVQAVADPTSEAAGIVADALDAFGEGGSAKRIRSSLRKQRARKRIPTGPGRKQAGLGAARGGIIPGHGLRDTVPLRIGRDVMPDDVIFNRHQQAFVQEAAVGGVVMAAPGERIVEKREVPRVDKRMRERWGFGVKDLFKRVRKPHYAAQGGVARLGPLSKPPPYEHRASDQQKYQAGDNGQRNQNYGDLKRSHALNPSRVVERFATGGIVTSRLLRKSYKRDEDEQDVLRTVRETVRQSRGGPLSPGAYRPNLRDRHPVSLREIAVRLFRGTDRGHLLPVELDVPPAPVVLSVRDRRQVRRVNTGPDVAKVVDLMTGRNRAFGAFVKDAVPGTRTPVVPQGGITSREATALPDPARRDVATVLNAVAKPSGPPVVAGEESAGIAHLSVGGRVATRRHVGDLPAATFTRLARHGNDHKGIRGQVLQGARRFASGGIVGLGRRLQKQGYEVSEHPRFGGVHPVHVKNSLHYSGKALDINNDDAPGGEDASLSKLARQLTRQGWHIIWHAPHHFDHLHVDTASGAGGVKGIGASAPRIGQAEVSGSGAARDIAKGALNQVVRAGNRRIARAESRAGVSAGEDLGPPPTGKGGGSSANQKLGRQLMTRMFPANQWPSLRALFQGESGWRTNADNPTSDAYGIPQSLPGSKMASAGADWRTNPATQIRWGLRYIKQRYGSPSKAYKAWLSRSPHWYSLGGPVEMWGGGPVTASKKYDYSGFGPDAKKDPKKKKGDPELFKAQHMGYTKKQWDAYIKSHHGQTPKQSAAEQKTKREDKRKREHERYVKNLRRHRRQRAGKVIRRIRGRSGISDVGKVIDPNITALDRRISGKEDEVSRFESAVGRNEIETPIFPREDLALPEHAGHRILDLGKEELGDLTLGDMHLAQIDPEIKLVSEKKWYQEGMGDLLRLGMKRIKAAIKRRKHELKHLKIAVDLMGDSISERRKKKPDKQRLNRLTRHLRTEAKELNLPEDSFIGDQGYQISLRKRLQSQVTDLTSGDSTTAIQNLESDRDTWSGQLDGLVGTTGIGGDLGTTKDTLLDLQNERGAFTEAGIRAALQGSKIATNTAAAERAQDLKAAFAAIAQLIKDYAPNFKVLPSFAKGGISRLPLALVGEEGPELAKLPTGKQTIVGAAGPEIRELPERTRIFSHTETKRKLGSTERIAKSLGIQPFAKGGTVSAIAPAHDDSSLLRAIERLEAALKAQKPSVVSKSIDARSYFKEVPPDPHAYSRSVRFELEAAV